MSDKFDGFSIHIVTDSDGDYVARLVELPNVSASGSTVEEAIGELEVAWDAMKESYRKHGDAIPIAPSRKEYSGQFNVRVDKRIHRALAIEAARVGISLNALVSQRLLQAVDHQYDTDI